MKKLSIALVFMILLFVDCRKEPYEPYRNNLLTATSWRLTDNNGELISNPEYCVLAFREDGSLMNFNFRKGYSTWRLTDNEKFLILDNEEFEIIKLTENELKIKYHTDLGQVYTFTSLSSVLAVTSGVSDISKNSVLLYGTVRTNNSSVNVSFEYGESTGYGLTAIATDVSVKPFTRDTVTAKITGLAPGKTYHYRFKSVGKSGTFYGYDNIFRTYNDLTVTDIDGNIYNTVTIGSQTWMTENLKTTRYSNGDEIPNVSNFADWRILTIGARCENYIFNDFHSVYGWFYNWYAVKDKRSICPIGWHVPTDEEWETLITNLGNNISAGTKLKESGTKHWISPNSASSNESGFSALPSGFRPELTGYINPGVQGIWWSVTEFDTNKAWNLQVWLNASWVNRIKSDKTMGYCVRCIQDKKS